MKPEDKLREVICPECEAKCFWIKNGRNVVMVKQSSVRDQAKLKRDDRGFAQIGRLKQHKHDTYKGRKIA